MQVNTEESPLFKQIGSKNSFFSFFSHVTPGTKVSFQREETTRVLIRNDLLIKIFNNNFVRYCGSESTYYTFVRGKTGL